MKTYFNTKKERIVVDLIPITEKQFTDLLKSEKPSEIIHEAWSQSRPFIEITEYNEVGLKCFCNGAADKTPKEKTFKMLYDSLVLQGLQSCFINVEEDKEKQKNEIHEKV